MIANGTRPTKHDHRDFDFIKSKKLGTTTVVTYPDNYSTDAGLWMPDQRATNPLFTPNVPPLPFGCTDYAQTDLCIDEDGELYNPAYLENITHANDNGGCDLRVSLNAVIKNGMLDMSGNVVHRGWHPAYFNIKPRLPELDWFDAIRLAMIVGQSEKRAVSVGTPWFPEFMSPVNGILPIPSWNLQTVSWHNLNMKGWKTIDGQPYLIGKAWIGKEYGDKGFCYVSRPLFNCLMAIPGTAAFTLDKLLPGETAQTIDSTTIQWLISFIRQLFHI